MTSSDTSTAVTSADSPAPAPKGLGAALPNDERLSPTSPAFSTGAVDWSKSVLWVLVLVVLAMAAYAWRTAHRLQQLEAELVKRQEASQGHVQEALALAKQSQELARETAAKTALLDAKLAETTLQRDQLNSLVQSLNQSRNQNLLLDLEASLRTAVQQAGLTGSPAPLVSALQSADERLTAAQQPQLETVRRAVLKDLDELKGTQLADIPNLLIRLDEAIRLVDQAPLQSQAMTSNALTPVAETATTTPKAKPTRTLQQETDARPTHQAATPTSWTERIWGWGRQTTSSVWQEAKSLVRVSRIAHPEAVLVAPEQSFFLRENIKLRLLNARLALLSRQSHTLQTDLRSVSQTLNMYFDPRSRQFATLRALLDDVNTQVQQLQIPPPDDSLAAMATLNPTP